MTDFLKNKNQRDQFLEETNSIGIMTRPIWTLMNKLPMFKDAQCDDLKNSEWLDHITSGAYKSYYENQYGINLS